MSIRTKLHPMGGGGGEITFVRPNLSADGTLGGNAFAVGSIYGKASNPAYYAVDSTYYNNTYWTTNLNANARYIFYNPKPLRVWFLTLNFTDFNYRATAVQVEGSNDGTNYTTIRVVRYTTVNGANPSGNADMRDNNQYYKYHRLAFTAYQHNNVLINNLIIQAKYK